jgi:hypothetical protein
MAIGCVRKHDSTRRVAGKIRRPLCQISDTHCRSRSGHGEPCHRKRTMTHAQCKVCKQTHGHRRSRHQQAISRQQEPSNDTTKAHQHDTQQEHIKHSTHAKDPPHSLHSVLASMSFGAASMSNKHKPGKRTNVARSKAHSRNTARTIAMPTRMANNSEFIP